MKIVTHGGNAHLDDFMSVAIALVKRTWDCSREEPRLPVESALGKACRGVVVERREPTPEELEDPEVLVLDVGGRYEPEKGDFDHHQFPKETKEAAMSLFAASIGLPDSAFGGTSKYVPGSAEYPCGSLASFLEGTFPWFRARVELDACGPFAAARGRGLSWRAVARFLGPLEGIVLGMFEDAEPEARMDVVKPLAETVLVRHRGWGRVMAAVKCESPRWADGDFKVADFTGADPADARECSGMFTRMVNGVAVFHDDRGPGLTLLRLHDDPRVDFTRVKDDPEVAFCHGGGFLVKTRTKDPVEARRLVEGAYAEEAAQ